MFGGQLVVHLGPKRLVARVADLDVGERSTDRRIDRFGQVVDTVAGVHPHHRTPPPPPLPAPVTIATLFLMFIATHSRQKSALRRLSLQPPRAVATKAASLDNHEPAKWRQSRPSLGEHIGPFGDRLLELADLGLRHFPHAIERLAAELLRSATKLLGSAGVRYVQR